MATVRKLERRSFRDSLRLSYWRRDFGVGVVAESKDFLVGGHRWSIQFYPMGESVDAYNKGYASLFIALHSYTPQPVEFLYSIAIINSLRSDDYRISSFHGNLYFRQVTFLSGGFMFGMPHFIPRSLLETRQKGYVINDVIKIVVSIGVLTCRPPISPLESSDLVYFQVADKTFCAEKSALARARCGASLLQPHRTVVVITDVEPQIFKVVLWYIYSKSVDERDKKAIVNSNGFNTPQSFAAKLGAAANKFELKGLAKMCKCIVSGKSVAPSIFAAMFELFIDKPLPDNHGDHMETTQQLQI